MLRKHYYYKTRQNYEGSMIGITFSIVGMAIFLFVLFLSKLVEWKKVVQFMRHLFIFYFDYFFNQTVYLTIGLK